MPRWCGEKGEATMSEMQAGRNAAVWFEIPAREFERTVIFYETLLGSALRLEHMGDTQMALFPYEQPGIGGAVIESTGLTPGGSGPLVYLNCDGHLDEAIARVQPAGGQLAGPKVDLPGDMGSFVHVIDPEGNRVGLHSR
jgi:hypothetical protein